MNKILSNFCLHIIKLRKKLFKVQIMFFVHFFLIKEYNNKCNNICYYRRVVAGTRGYTYCGTSQ